MVIGRSARMPTTSDRFSRSPPQTAPSILAASAELGESIIRNSSANKSPAKKTGIAKVKATREPTYLVEPEMLLKGIKYAMSKLPRSPITVQDRRHNSGLSSIITFLKWQIEMIFFTRLAHDMRMTCKELGRKVHDVLVPHVIDK